ncbi:hypothetical protein QA640_07195 [Bradyrhizobium sp. CB82]|uniref:hypothetical protein n=1 Tax=Bradyrhizobium sp. CB82 TaxID=3039159 RepID=UPI0024B0C3A2|nr:hypothetical protein [Bradyrhizobium sp. CB82]WFU42251.1 hypothetical protein QA640_07195 [Bradyrhizobium sp. CB82]
MIKHHIAHNLETDLLTAAELCREFRISRASLYRLFEADGGLAHYIREQRLNLAFRQLLSPAAQDNRLIDLARAVPAFDTVLHQLARRRASRRQ